MVLNITLVRKTNIYGLLYGVLCTTTLKAWQKQAIKCVARAVMSSPLTVQSFFNYTIIDTAGHVALIPVTVFDHSF